MPTTKQKKPRAPAAANPAVTMADLARLAGVSKITVSRALGESTTVNAKTRIQIRALASKHGYKMNVSARNLRLRRSHTVAVIVEMKPSIDRPMSHPYPLDLLGGILQELASNNFSALLTTRQGVSLPAIQSADAVILLGQGAHLDAVHLLDTLRLPMVIWGAQKISDDHVVVGSDNRQGGAAAAERFVSIGRRHPVFLGDTSHAELAERRAGFETALAAHGIKSGELRCEDFTVDSGFRAVKTMSKKWPRVDAIFAGSDLLAMGAVRALAELGQRVPEDVSVIGYDDMLLSAAFIPPLTTVHQNWDDGGRLLARKALALIRGERAGSEVLPNYLVIRST